MNQPIVDISNLSYRYETRLALDSLTLSVNRGEIFGFLGPNGSGKTTLFRLLSTLIPAPENSIRMFGLDAATATREIRSRIGVVFQSPSLDKQLTAEENLWCHGQLYGLSGRDLKKRTAEMLQRVSLQDRAGERVESFSGGMRRRVELAKGLLNNPELLLLDEPSTGLDPGARIDLWQALKEIQAQGVTVMVTTHLMDEADRCSRLAIMAGGRLVTCDEPAKLKEQIGGDVITIVSKDPAILQKALHDRLGIQTEVLKSIIRIERPRGHEFIPQLIEAAPGLVESISVGRPTLEDVFITLTGRRLADDA